MRDKYQSEEEEDEGKMKDEGELMCNCKKWSEEEKKGELGGKKKLEMMRLGLAKCAQPSHFLPFVFELSADKFSSYLRVKLFVTMEERGKGR
jgi:hypothetical protein